MSNGKNVALVLSSGGPRGFAYIGAIEEIEKAGYTITSVAGTSMGALIGGMYAAGKLDAVKEWFYRIDTWKMLSLIDFSFSKNYLVKGVRVIEALKEIVPDVNIEDLPVPFCAVATDLYTGEEVVFDKGSLFEAIRASISLPSLFRPAKQGIRTMIDGGIVNPLPLDRVKRTPGDILVALNVNHIDRDNIKALLIEAMNKEEDKNSIIDTIREHGHDLFYNLFQKRKASLVPKEEDDDDDKKDISDIEDNYYTILSQSFSLMIHRNTELALRLYKPDILVNIPYDAFGEFDYDKAQEISEMGGRIMKEALGEPDIKALFFDIDGTLISLRSRTITESAMSALAAAKKAGKKIFIATGRPDSLIDIPEGLKNIVDGYVTTNGAHCHYEGQNIILKKISRDNVLKIWDICNEKSIPVMFVGLDGIHIFNNNEHISKILGELIVFPSIKTDSDKEAVLKDTIIQISPVMSPQEEAELMPLIKGCSSCRWTDLFMDIVAEGVDKAEGIRSMASHLGFTMDECMAFGDGGNDIPMLKAVRTGIAMGNATDDVKEAADYITDEVDKDGIMNALKHFHII